MKRYRNIQAIFIVVILAVAFSIRLIGLNQSLWLDEGIEWWAVRTFSLHQLLSGYMTGDFNPPAHHLLMWLWIRAFGDSVQVMRFPSVLFGVGTVWFIYKIANFFTAKEEKKLENWPFGISGMAAILSAFSGLLVYYSQEARMYAMAAFFVTSAVYYFLRCQERPSRVLFTAYCLLFTAALYSHYLTWFLLPILALFGLRYCIPFFLTIPWWPELSRQLESGLSTAQNPVWASLGEVSPKSIALVFVKFVTGRIPFPETRWLIVATSCIVAVFWILAWIGAQQVWNKEINGKKVGRLLVLWPCGSLLIGAVVGVIVPIFSYFRFLFVLPGIFILVAFGLSKKRNWLEPLAASLLLFTIISVSGPINKRENWQGLVEELHQRESNPAVFIYPAVRPPFDYYDRNSSVVIDASSLESSSFGLYSSLWYISYAEDIFGPEHGVEQTLSEKKYSRTFIRHYRGVTLQHWEKSNEQ